MRNRKLAITVALGALAAGCFAGYRRSQARAGRPAAPPDYLQTWEGEGGGVPVDEQHTAAQVAPQELRRGEREAEPPPRSFPDGSPSSVSDTSPVTAARRP